jgi:hypothetical protein
VKPEILMSYIYGPTLATLKAASFFWLRNVSTMIHSAAHHLSLGSDGLLTF